MPAAIPVAGMVTVQACLQSISAGASLWEAPVASAAQTSCWETFLLLPQVEWRQLVCFVLLPVTHAAGNSSKIGVLKSFLKGCVPRKRNAVGGPSCAGFLGAGRGLREETPPCQFSSTAAFYDEKTPRTEQFN